MSDPIQSPRCGKCGAPLSGFAPDGLCAACLLECALEPPEDIVPAGAPPAPRPTVKVALPEEETPGAIIGRYKLLEKVGEGGFGVIYVAEQREPVKRRVALKIIKLGMDTRQVVARFEAERQALALMDHPNIARVFDAGATETGRPYFVMELVRGIKITDYCDQNNLSTRERLDLFIKVCQAIQHAHQKGIIHRDIKPSNTLVTVNDGVPVPKVIDFGIAKATQGELTDKTLYTQFQQFIGTPAYMSPEQAEMTSLDIDTRCDIYALGVLLYELLTGKTPFEQKDLLKAGLDGIRRIIREQEPPRPSTRVSLLRAEERTTTAKRRSLDLPKLVHLLRGDLDWIVMKCLEKDRTRRYETANGLAMDVQRYLKQEPVMACPPSSWYRFKKVVQRNRPVVAATCGVTLSLLAGSGISTWLWLKARAASSRLEEVAQGLKVTQIWRTRVPPTLRRPSVEVTSNSPVVVPPGDPRLNGTTYAQWASAWFKWAHEMPLTNSSGGVHPFYDTPDFDVAAAQGANVWFLAAPFEKSGMVERRCRIPTGKALFFPIFCVELSNLEADFFAETAADQAAWAAYLVDCVSNLFLSIDGQHVGNLAAYRTASPQTVFNAPTPWIQGEIGGIGTSSGDGYFIFLSPLPPGEHTLHFGASIKMTSPMPLDARINMTYHLNVTDSTIAVLPTRKRNAQSPP